ALGRRAAVLPCDVSKAAEVDRMAAEATRDLGAPSVVVHAAGTVARKSVLQTTEADWGDVVGSSLKGAFLVVRAPLAPMIAQKRGRIVVLGSISSTLGTPRLTAYCAAKWGALGFVKSLAEELRTTGVQAMCVLPGSVDTPMLVGSGFAPQMPPE